MSSAQPNCESTKGKNEGLINETTLNSQFLIKVDCNVFPVNF